jgi:putative transposase
MPKPYSLDLRSRVIKRVKSGKESHQQIADSFEIGVATLRRWIKLNKDYGSLSHKIPTTTRPRKVDYKKVEKFIENNPDKTLKELAIKFGVVESVIFYILKRLGITYKKTLPIRGKTGRFEGRISKDFKPNSKRKSNLS